MTRPIFIVGVAAAVVGAFALGTRFGGAPERVVVDHEVRRAVTTPVVVAAPSAASAAPTPDQIRAIVREELAAARDEHAVVEAPAVVEARQQSADRGHAVIAHAITTGVWSEQDRDSLRQAVAGVDREQADRLLSELFPALNDGRVKLDYRGGPL